MFFWACSGRFCTIVCTEPTYSPITPSAASCTEPKKNSPTGAAIALTPRPVVVIAGDGAFQCNLQELQTVVRNHLPVKIVIINNHCHGMVRQFQQSYFNEQFQSTLWGYDMPGFVRVAESFGIDAFSVKDDSMIEEGLKFLWQDPSSPALLDVTIDTFTNAYPKIAFGRPLTEMEPDFQPTAMEST